MGRMQVVAYGPLKNGDRAVRRTNKEEYQDNRVRETLEQYLARKNAKRKK